MDRSKVGTKISLSDRFKLIRQEQQTRKIIVNPLIESPTPKVGGGQKNSYPAVSRDDRPSAFLHQGSERNRRLVLQMAANTTLIDEINMMTQKRATNFIVNTPETIGISPMIRKTGNANVRARLGIRPKNSSIFSRLGKVRKPPITERLGLPAQNLKARGRINAGKKRTNGLVVTNSNRKRQNNNTNIKAVRPNKRSGGKNQKKRRQANTKSPLTAEKLNEDLDVYMSSAGN